MKRLTGRQERAKQVNGRGSDMLISLDEYNAIYRIYSASNDTYLWLYLIGLRRCVGFTLVQCSLVVGKSSSQVGRIVDKVRLQHQKHNAKRYSPEVVRACRDLKALCKSFAVRKVDKALLIKRANFTV